MARDDGHSTLQSAHTVSDMLKNAHRPHISSLPILTCDQPAQIGKWLGDWLSGRSLKAAVWQPKKAATACTCRRHSGFGRRVEVTSLNHRK
eukprot:2050032-Amphidinium_carterae.1